jgi:dihydrolipoamide dehydrogenase
MAEYNVIVIGAGPGGYVCAIKCAQLGLSVALVEERDVGGTCLNRGCIPTKALLHSAEIYDSIKDAEKYGVLVENAGFNFAGIQAKKAEVVMKLRTGVEALVAANKITLLRGKGVILGSGKVQVGETVYTCDKTVIATGSVPAVPPIPGLDQEGVITSDGLLENTNEFDDSMVIIGGGVIGVEFASVYASLGCQVTIVEALPRLLARMDKDISQNLQMILKKKGVKVCVDSKVLKVERAEDGSLDVHYEFKGKEAVANGKKVLVAIGRRPNTQGLFGEGVELAAERGRLLVNDKFETSLKDVYAIGDVSTTLQLAHVASAQGIYVAELLAGKEPEGDLSLVPSCIYTSPEIASVGLTEEEAVAAGYTVKADKVMMHSNGKTIIAGGERGFMKIVTEVESGRILGAQLMCERATDMLSEFTSAMVGGLDAHTMGKVMRPHPTFNEGVSELFEMVNGGASIHTAPAKKR